MEFGNCLYTETFTHGVKNVSQKVSYRKTDKHFSKVLQKKFEKKQTSRRFFFFISSCNITFTLK